MSLAHAAPAFAAGEIWLTWDDCANGAGVHDLTFACDDNVSEFQLYCSFSAPLTTSADVIGIECVVDVQHSLSALPDWWLMSASGDCRSGALLANSSFGGGGSCVDPWLDMGAAEIQGYVYGEPRNSPSQVRIKAVAGVPSSDAATLTQGEFVYGLNLVLRAEKTSGTGSCAGCSSPACLVLNSILIRRIPGSAGGDQLLDTPGGAEGNRATWRGGVGADCTLVPVRRSSWGAIKSLYR